MKVTIICPAFPPEPAPAGLMAEQFAQALVQDGHSVSVITQFPSRPNGRLYPGFPMRFRKATNESGIRIIRSAHWLLGQRRSIDRLLENTTFGISSAICALLDGKPDILIVENWPLFATQFGIWLGRAWGIPVINYVQDVYPEAAEELGVLKPGGRTARMLRRWDLNLCNYSSRVIAISDTMRALLCNRGLPSDKVAVIRNWLACAGASIENTDTQWRREKGIGASVFVAMFGGTLGLVSGAEILIDVAEQLRHAPDVLLVCVGEGVLKERMTQEARRRALTNIRFEPFERQERVSEVQASANAMLLTVRKGYSDASIPSKLISYLAAGRPVICSVPAGSAIASTVREAEAGIVEPAGDPVAIANAIRRISNDVGLAVRLGSNARRCYEQHFTFDRAYQQFQQLITELTGTPYRSINDQQTHGTIRNAASKYRVPSDAH